MNEPTRPMGHHRYCSCAACLQYEHAAYGTPLVLTDAEIRRRWRLAVLEDLHESPERGPSPVLSPLAGDGPFTK